MKKRIPHKQLPGKDSHTFHAANTGEHCPLNGWWVPATREGKMRFIAEGSIMPADEGKSVTWTLAASDFRLRKPTYTHPAVGASIDSY
jgi:hypothetical protein